MKMAVKCESWRAESDSDLESLMAKKESDNEIMKISMAKMKYLASKQWRRNTLNNAIWQ
jgi:hypothetical protein